MNFEVVSTSKVPRRAPDDGGLLCLIHCCAETILCRTMPNVSYARKKNVFFDDMIFISINHTFELLKRRSTKLNSNPGSYVITYISVFEHKFSLLLVFISINHIFELLKRRSTKLNSNPGSYVITYISVFEHKFSLLLVFISIHHIFELLKRRSTKLNSNPGSYVITYISVY